MSLSQPNENQYLIQFSNNGKMAHRTIILNLYRAYRKMEALAWTKHSLTKVKEV